jgi:hypothetical protein
MVGQSIRLSCAAWADRAAGRIEIAVGMVRSYSASAENQITQQWDKKRKA